MSNKKMALDVLGETHIPSDLLTPTLGSNYGLDGFEDLQYGMGVLEGVRDPALLPGPALPTGLVKGGADGGMDLTAMLGEESLADLDWLDPTQLPDPERLPKNPVNLGIPELEEAWGVNRRTNGVTVVAARDLGRARYEESLLSDSNKKKATPRQMMAVITHAMRRSAAHQDIDVVVREAMESMGEEMGRIASALKVVKEDHGLAGNVFVRASAFPEYGTGRWTSFIKKHASQARYLIVAQEDLNQATWIQNGRCAYTGKLAVTEVPWKSAHNHYAPRLELSGRKASLGSNPRESLRLGFLSLPDRKVSKTEFPVQALPAKISSEEAWKSLSSQKVEPKVYDSQTKRVAQGVSKIAAAIKKGTAGTLLSNLIRSTFLDSDLKVAVRQLAPLLKNGLLDETATDQVEYGGPKYQVHAMSRPVNMGDPKASILSKTAASALGWIRRSMSEGWAGKPLDELIQQRFANAVLSDIEAPLQDLRAAHEGGSGFMYVDAAAYASPLGVKGCETGALKHRANQIPAVMRMDRCASCSLVRTSSDGTQRCSVYNKALLEDTGGLELQGLREANIRVANMGDAEQTAAMFASPENAYQPSEFGLKNSNLEDLEVVELPEIDKMAVLFGGWNL